MQSAVEALLIDDALRRARITAGLWPPHGRRGTPPRPHFGARRARCRAMWNLILARGIAHEREFGVDPKFLHSAARRRAAAAA